MARKVVDETRAIESSHVNRVKRQLTDSIGYLLDMERMFGHDTWRLFELVRPKIDAVLKDRQNEAKFEEFQLFARAFIRAVFAHAEGVTYLMRQAVLWAYDRGEIELDEAELSELREPKLRTKDSFVLSFEKFPRLFRSLFRLDRDSPGWNYLCRSIKVRDEITHPKAITDFKVSGDAIREAHIAAVWFNETFCALLLSCSDDTPKADRSLH